MNTRLEKCLDGVKVYRASLLGKTSENSHPGSGRRRAQMLGEGCSPTYPGSGRTLTQGERGVQHCTVLISSTARENVSKFWYGVLRGKKCEPVFIEWWDWKMSGTTGGIFLGEVFRYTEERKYSSVQRKSKPLHISVRMDCWIVCDTRCSIKHHNSVVICDAVARKDGENVEEGGSFTDGQCNVQLFFFFLELRRKCGPCISLNLKCENNSGTVWSNGVWHIIIQWCFQSGQLRRAPEYSVILRDYR